MKGWRMEGIALDHNPSFHFDYRIIVKPNRYNCVTRITVFIMLSALSVQNTRACKIIIPSLMRHRKFQNAYEEISVASINFG